jgi:SEC-C motif-containing protein
MQKNDICFCGNSMPFSMCCEPYLTLNDKPSSAEQLMRSRYSAFVTKNDAYLLMTWQPDKRPKKITFELDTKWLGLKVKRCKTGLALDIQGWVEFIARFKINGKAERIEELSYFIKDDQQWLYVCAETKSWDKLK